jgi:hypothetical protein
MIRMMSGVLLAAGAVACNNDASIDLSGPPTKIQASPQIMFATQGADENLYLRLVDDANYSVPVGPYTVSDVGAGITVTWDEGYRPDYTSGELKPNPIQSQHHYIVRASEAVSTSFKVTNSGITQEIKVIVVPSTLGSGLSITAPAIGDQVTLTLPANLSFTTEGDDASVITVGGDDVVVTEMTASTVTFYPLPGSGGAVEATNINVAYSPTLDPIDLATSVELAQVPEVENIPLAFSSAAPAAGAPVTISASGVVFHPDLQVAFGDKDAFVVSVASDGSSAVILPPLGVTDEVATVSNFNLASLAPVTLSGIPSVSTITTTANYAAAGAGGTSFGNAIALSGAVSTTAGAFAAEAGPVTFGPDVNYLGGNNAGGPRYYKLTVAEAGTYDINMGWTGGDDFDLYVRTDGDEDVDNSPSGDNPEHVQVDLDPGTYYIVFHNWHNSSSNPTWVLITVAPAP